MCNNLEYVKKQYINFGRLCNLITIQFNNDGWHKIVLVNDSMNSLNNANSQIWQFLMRHIILLNIDNILKTLHISLFASIDRFDLVFYNKVRIFMKARMEQLLLHLANHIILRY